MVRQYREVVGEPPFFIQAMHTDGRTHMAGHCHDGDRAGRIKHVMSTLLDTFKGLIAYGQDHTSEEQEKRKWDAYRRLQKFDRNLTQDTMIYQVVYVMNYDKDLDPDLAYFIDQMSVE